MLRAGMRCFYVQLSAVKTKVQKTRSHIFCVLMRMLCASAYLSTLNMISGA